MPRSTCANPQTVAPFWSGSRISTYNLARMNMILHGVPVGESISPMLMALMKTINSRTEWNFDGVHESSILPVVMETLALWPIPALFSTSSQSKATLFSPAWILPPQAG